MAEIASFGVNIDENTLLAQNAQNTADSAAGGVTNLNDPNLMSVIEKQYNISQFAGLTSQYNVIVQNAKDDGIDTTALTTAYNNLNQFMAGVLADPDHASDVDRVTYKKYQDAYNQELANIQNALQNNANNKFTSAASAESQAASTASQAFSQANSAIGVANGATAEITKLSGDINLRVTKDGLIDQINIQAGNTLISSSGQLTLSGKTINFDTANPVIIPSANIDTLLTRKTLKAADITANTFSTNNETFTVDKYGAITAKNMTINGGTLTSPTINGSTINTPTLDLGTNGILTTDFDINQPTGFYGPKKGTGTLTIKTGVINSSSQNMSRYSNTAAYWYGFDDNGNMVKNGTNQTGDDYAPGYEKHDIMKSNGNVLNRSYLDAMGLTLNEGGTRTFNTMLTAIGLETGNALLHKDLATEGTFEAALGTGNKYGFRIGSKVIAPMIRANEYTYAADVFISRYGTMGLSTSTKANKLDIVDVPDMLQKGYNLLTLNPRQWFDKTSVEAYADVQAGNTDSVEGVVDIKPVSGMVAEEVASAGLDDYVVKDENNKVQGLAYDRLWTLLLPVLRDMNDKINKLQKKVGI
ncbi:hypothetical protein NVV76_10425 [Pediococcus ethanolidurans]|uniref:hypothetical protein n=1 Tax=Pediococcus ethanolidurans TaxID=319653 RepID=UPI0021E92D73|nr:hypothetical protein [Pediococcus ethanolidurans]MCV3328562.1 hypothetical protein [Pediococcus ethanolidurans]